MHQYETFIFESFSFNPHAGKIELHYSLDDEVHFTETITLPRRGLRVKSVAPQLLQRALFALHLIGGISYFKTCCPKKIVIRSGSLNAEQAAFWNTVYEDGLGEFFYRNNIDFRGLINFPVETEQQPSYIPHTFLRECALVPVGGGKDSAVTMALLQQAEIPFVLFRMGTHPIIQNIADATNTPLLLVERSLSPRLFSLNKEGALNGHVPITAYLSFLTAVTSLLYGFNAVIFSNERSANVGSLIYYGKEINHQWSKSLAFERLLQRYLHNAITPDLQIFSLLRPFTELKIIELFAKHPIYLSLCTSCNRNWKILASSEQVAGSDQHTTDYPLTANRSPLPWCGSCPKCAFVFTLYCAFLPKETVLSVFGKNLFEDANLLPTFRELLGMEGFKPFECVGTPEEMTAALLLIRDRGEFTDTPVVQLFLREQLPKIEDAQEIVKRALSISPDHAIPPSYATVLTPA